MKKILSIVLALTVLFSFVSCGKHEKAEVMIGIETSSEIEKFYSYMEKGEYKKGADLYFDKIAVSSAGIDEVASVCTEIFTNMTSDYLAGKISKAEVERRMVLIREIEELVYVSNPYSEYESVCESKENYEKGLQYLANNSYEDAITLLKQVRKDDCNYDDAQSKISVAKASYKRNILTDVEIKVNNAEIVDALSMLKYSLDVLEGDTEIESLINKYENQYVDGIIEDSKKLFINPASDWEPAFTLIKQAQQHLPDNAKLLKAEEYYTQFKPVSFSKLKSYDEGSVKLSTYKDEEDTLGNSYSVSFRCFTEGKQYNVYDIGKKYNVLTGIVAVSDNSKGTTHTGKIEIYGDGNLLWESETVTSSTKPYEISVDVTGVTDLKIYMTSTGNEINVFDGMEVLFAEPTLQRTVK